MRKKLTGVSLNFLTEELPDDTNPDDMEDYVNNEDDDEKKLQRIKMKV